VVSDFILSGVDGSLVRTTLVSFILSANHHHAHESIELCQAPYLAFVAFSRALGQSQGQVFVLLVIVVFSPPPPPRPRKPLVGLAIIIVMPALPPGNASTSNAWIPHTLMPVLAYLWILPLLPLPWPAANGIFLAAAGRKGRYARWRFPHKRSPFPRGRCEYW